MGDDALVEELLALLDDSLGEGVAEGKPTVVTDACHSGYVFSYHFVKIEKKV